MATTELATFKASSRKNIGNFTGKKITIDGKTYDYTGITFDANISVINTDWKKQNNDTILKNLTINLVNPSVRVHLFKIESCSSGNELQIHVAVGNGRIMPRVKTTKNFSSPGIKLNPPGTIDKCQVKFIVYKYGAKIPQDLYETSCSKNTQKKIYVYKELKTHKKALLRDTGVRHTPDTKKGNVIIGNP